MADPGGALLDSGAFRLEFTVPDSAVDENLHVNNVVYVQWMQDVAVRHAAAAGCTRETQARGATWVVRSHTIEYLRPSFAGDRLAVETWVADARRALSTRGYRFLRAEDGKVVVTGETQWVYVDAASGRPRDIPREVIEAFRLLPGGPGG
jgi:acyl-CoA thioester hydrolase